ncbi:MAG: DUF58 domain-containing protein [Pseudomonadota bacterium]
MATAAFEALNRELGQRFRRWVNRRIPPSRSVTLDQKRLFIFPSRVGFFFLFCLLLMLMTSINYQNNMAFALTFLLATLFVIAVLHTYANLAGLTVHAVSTQSAFPEQQAQFQLLLERRRRKEHFDLHMGWPESNQVVLNLVDTDTLPVELYLPVGARGWYSPGRLRLESTYPLGLLRCWTWIDLDLHALVYPSPLASEEPPGVAAEAPDGAAQQLPGIDDFYGLRPYREGDSLRQINWKGVAKGQGLLTKQYSAYAQRSLWLDWDDFPGTGTEQRLSHLCYWALEHDAQNEEYGLRLPGARIAPGCGERHREDVLRALALHGIEQARA